MNNRHIFTLLTLSAIFVSSYVYTQKNITYISSVEEIKKIVSTHENVIIDVYAPWCKPCQNMNPTLENVAKTFNNVKIIKVNVDKVNKNALNTLLNQNVRSIPLLVFFHNGKAIQSFTGQQKLAWFKTTIQKTFNV